MCANLNCSRVLSSKWSLHLILLCSGRETHFFIKLTLLLLIFSWYQLQAVQLPALCTPYHALQHRCLWQWLCSQPENDLSGNSQGLHEWLELWLRACAPASHTPKPILVSRRELWKLPTFSIHREELLSSPLPTSTLSLYRLLLRRGPPPLTASNAKVYIQIWLRSGGGEGDTREGWGRPCTVKNYKWGREYWRYLYRRKGYLYIFLKQQMCCLCHKNLYKNKFVLKVLFLQTKYTEHALNLVSDWVERKQE